MPGLESKRFIGGGRKLGVKGHVGMGQTDRETMGRREARERRGRGGKKRQERKEEPRVERRGKRASCAWQALLRGAHVA